MPHVSQRGQIGLVIGLLLIGIMARLLPHPPNATPLMAIALFGGTYLPKRWAIWVPLAIVALSDLILGWHSTVPFTWSACLLTGVIAWWVRGRLSVTRIIIGALVSSWAFFLITNFGVWVTQTLYPKTAAGLWTCYVAALPFFRNMLAGDLLSTGILFGLFVLLDAQSTRLAAGRS